MSTIAQRIRAVLVARAETIRQVDGYATDMGLRVYRGASPLQFAPADLEIGPVLIIGPDAEGQESAVQRVGRKQRNELRIAATALMLADDLNPLDAADTLLADLKTGLLPPDATAERDAAGVLGEAIEYAGSRYELPGPGEQIVTAEMILTCRYAEARGQPTTTA